MRTPPALTRRLAMMLPAAAALMLFTATGAFAQGKPAVGKPAPEISGKDIEGKPLALSSFKGKVVMLDFWGDW